MSRARDLLRVPLRATAVLAVAVVPLASVPVAAAAVPPSRPTGAHVVTVRDVAGHSPYVGRQCNVATPYYTQPGGKEGEPFVAVDPANPRHRIATWMDATRATVDVAYTRDGGRTWRRSVPRLIDACTGDRSQPWEASGDPWLSFGPDGVAYLSTLTWAHFVTPPASAYVSVVHVQTSRDGGRTWSRPVFLAGHDAVSDKPMVAADPYRSGTAYEIWRNQSFGLPVGPRGATELLFARTTNGGRTWTAPRRIASGSDADFFGSPQLSVLRSGTLVATSSLANPAGGTDILAYRSTNLGRSWSAPVVVRTAPAGALAPICGQSVAGADTSSASGQQTVLRGRTVVLVVQDGPAASAGHGRLVASWSQDGGRTWHSRTVLAVARPVLLASVAADRRGRLGLVWDEVDLAHANCATPTVPARTRFSTSSDSGRSWSRPVTLGARWWDLASGARGTGGFSGYFIGDYQALAPVPGGFTTITVQGRALLRGPRSAHVVGETGVVLSVVHAVRS